MYYGKHHSCYLKSSELFKKEKLTLVVDYNQIQQLTFEIMQIIMNIHPYSLASQMCSQSITDNYLQDYNPEEIRKKITRK